MTTPVSAARGRSLGRRDARSVRRGAARSRAPIRSVLLDQTVLAGLGNIYANEALARAGISPLRRARAISARRIGAPGRRRPSKCWGRRWRRAERPCATAGS